MVLHVEIPCCFMRMIHVVTCIEITCCFMRILHGVTCRDSMLLHEDDTCCYM